MFSKTTSLFFNSSRGLAKLIVTNESRISSICRAIQSGKLTQADHLVVQFANEQGWTHHGMLKQVIEVATQCNQPDFAKEVTNIHSKLLQEVEMKEYFSTTFQ